eukprot:TRINITY_DN23478_c0_g1_i1.p1 TRINITY_DN23478_c0_g1~~TRINITY_DN23478_c0_g1_i1.p1  ORF type:complete len:184 (+),score=18.32 TRINITY_DN23478_c0_g1_i1:91-642(+)
MRPFVYPVVIVLLQFVIGIFFIVCIASSREGWAHGKDNTLDINFGWQQGCMGRDCVDLEGHWKTGGNAVAASSVLGIIFSLAIIILCLALFIVKIRSRYVWIINIVLISITTVTWICWIVWVATTHTKREDLGLKNGYAFGLNVTASVLELVSMIVGLAFLYHTIVKEPEGYTLIGSSDSTPW